MTERTITDEEGGEVLEIEYVDANGRVVKSIDPRGIKLDSNWKVQYRKKVYNYEYNDQGLLIKITSSKGKDVTTYKYNENNQLVSMNIRYYFSPEQKIENIRTDYKYNTDRQLIKISSYENEKYAGGVSIYYDKNNKEAQRKYIFDDDTVYRIVKYQEGQVVSDKEVDL